MFTPSMTNEEVEVVAYKDLLKIQERVEIARDKFIQRVKYTPPGFWILRSLRETHTLQTRSRNAWAVYFYYLYTAPAGTAKVSPIIYTSLSGDEGTGYLSMNSLDRLRLERMSSCFSRQHGEHYIGPNQIQLNDLLPATYFTRTIGDRKIVPCVPDTWTKEKKKDKYLFMSEQGTIKAKPEEYAGTYLTSLRPEQPDD